MALSAEQLLSIARHYWPSNKDTLLQQERGPEMERLYEQWAEELQKLDRWKAFLEDLERELPEFTLGSGTATADACFRCVAYPAKGQPLPSLRWVVVGCVSILAPVYTVYGVQFEYTDSRRIFRKLDYGPLPAEVRRPAEIIARRIEATFGAEVVSREVAATPVPLFVQWKEPPDTTLFHALFTNEPENLP
jgi:hypothetical protein